MKLEKPNNSKPLIIQIYCTSKKFVKICNKIWKPFRHKVPETFITNFFSKVKLLAFADKT